MSLLDEAMEGFMLLNKVRVPDGYGGTITQWTDGAVIKGAIVYNSGAQVQIAQSMGAMGSYTLTVRKNVELDYHDVIRRLDDGKIFRITSNSDELKTPDSATLNMRNYNAEEWELPNE